MKQKPKKNILYNLISRFPKRIRFVISSGTMTTILLISTFFDFSLYWIFVPILILAAYFFTFFALFEGINKAEWLTLFIMPVLFTVFVYLVYFLFPTRWLTRLPLLVVYGFSLYALLLTSNIFNVGVEKNIQLFRAAFSVNYLFQTLIMYLSSLVVISFRQGFLINGTASFVVATLLAMQLFWSVKPKVTLDKGAIIYALLTGVLIMQAAVLLSFMPLRTTIFALAICALYYSIGGLLYHYIDSKLFKQTVREYTVVLVFVAVIVLLTISW